MFIRILILSLTFTFTMLSHAECEIQRDQLGAHYRITTIDHQTGKQSDREFTLWRDGEQVAHQYHNKGMTELWQRTSNERLRTVHYFDRYYRGIEYDPVEVKISHSLNDWQLKYQLVSEGFIKMLNKQSAEGRDCQVMSVHTQTSKTSNVMLQWLDNLHLAKVYVEETPQKTVKWLLVEMIDNPQLVEHEFTLRANYKTTDYTDIGDNESDPFLIRMINLGHISHGASGFYDQDGHSLGQVHKH